MTDQPDEPMTRDEALVTMYKELWQRMRTGDARGAEPWRQAIADVIDPPVADPSNPDTIVGGPVSYAESGRDGPAPRRPATPAELAKTYAELSAWARANGEPEHASRFDTALSELGNAEPMRPERLPEVLELATRTLAPGWVRPVLPDSVRVADRMFRDTPAAAEDRTSAGTEADAADTDQPAPARRHTAPGQERGQERGQGPGQDPGARRGRH